MAAKMATEILNRMYLSSPVGYKNKWSVHSYEVKDVEFKYVEINNNKCIFFKMAAKMAAKNQIIMYLGFPFRYKDKWSVFSYEMKDVQFKYKEISNSNCIISKMAAKMSAENLILMSQLCFQI